MTTAYTSLLGLALPVTGELSGTWGDTVNNSITSLLDSAIAGTTTLSSDADVTLTSNDGTADTSRQAILLWTAGGTVTRNITAPAQSKIYTVINASSSTQSIVLRGVGPTTGVTIVKGESAVCAWNGSDFIKISNTGGAAVFTTLDVTNLEVTNIKALDGTSAASIANSTGVISLTANPILSGGTANGVAYLDGSKVLTTGSALVFDGTNLGVGTAAPSGYLSGTAKLVVLGNANSQHTALIRNDNAGSSASAALALTASGNTWGIECGSSAKNSNALTFQIDYGVTNSTKMTLTDSGNLGIGSTSPIAKLDISGISTTQNGLRLTATSGGQALAAFTADTSTGEIRIGGTVAAAGNYFPVFYAAGSERARIDSSGNLGIGGASTGSRLYVTATNPTATFKATTTGYPYAAFVNDGGDFYVGRDNSAGGAFGYAYANVIWGSGAQSTVFGTSNLVRMTLDASGNLGIGTTSPGYKLDVLGNVNRFAGASVDGIFLSTVGATDTSYYGANYYNNNGTEGVNASGRASWRIATLTAGSPTFSIGYRAPSAGAGVFSTPLTIDASGNLGVGTTSPTSTYSARLAVVPASGAAAISIDAASGNNTGINFYNNGTAKWTTQVLTTGEFRWFDFTASAERMRIDSSGRLIIGNTTMPVGYGTALNVYTTGVGARVYGTAEATGPFWVDKQTNTSSTSQVFIQFTINTQATGNGQINGNGASQVAFGSFSDARLKENIVDLPPQLDNIMALRPVEFDYIESEGGGHQTSFIAQEFEEVYPDAIGERADGMKTLTGWGKTEARLVKAIQEQQAIITTLTARITALEGA
jgi:hypothetical protein